MKMAKVKEDVQIASLRSLDDFIMESARFQIPNFKDGEKWGNRVFNNLLYYQTNYFLTGLIVFLVVGLIHPVKMFYGFLALAVAFGLFYYITYDRRPTAHKFKRDHPLISIVVVLSGCYFIVYMLGSVVVFITGILLPVIVVFIHASMRQRNIKNKIANKMEHIGLQRTPMGIFLESLGQEQEMWS